MPQIRPKTLKVFANPSLGIVDPIMILDGMFIGSVGYDPTLDQPDGTRVGCVPKVLAAQEMHPIEQRSIDRGTANARSQRLEQVNVYHGVPATLGRIAALIVKAGPVSVPATDWHKARVKEGCLVAADQESAAACGVKFADPKKKLVDDEDKAIAAYDATCIDGNGAKISNGFDKEFESVRAEKHAKLVAKFPEFATPVAAPAAEAKK